MDYTSQIFAKAVVPAMNSQQQFEPAQSPPLSDSQSEQPQIERTSAPACAPLPSISTPVIPARPLVADNGSVQQIENAAVFIPLQGSKSRVTGVKRRNRSTVMCAHDATPLVAPGHTMKRLNILTPSEWQLLFDKVMSHVQASEINPKASAIARSVHQQFSHVEYDVLLGHVKSIQKRLDTKKNVALRKQAEKAGVNQNRTAHDHHSLANQNVAQVSTGLDAGAGVCVAAQGESKELARLKAELLKAKEERQAEKCADEERAREAAQNAAEELARLQAELLKAKEERQAEKCADEERAREVAESESEELARLQAKLFLVEEARQAEKRAGEGRARDAAEVAAKRLARCKAKLVVYREERKKEKIQIEEIERSIEQRANQVVALKAQLKNQEAENEEQRKVLELRNQIAKQHTEAMRKMKSKNKSLANENEQLNEVVASLQREVQTLKASIEQLKQQQVAMPSVSTTAAAALEAKEIEFSQARIGILLFVKSIEVEENLRAFHSLFWNLLLSVETVRVKLGSSAWQRPTLLADQIRAAIAVAKTSGNDRHVLFSLTTIFNTWKHIRNEICHSSCAYKIYIDRYERYSSDLSRLNQCIATSSAKVQQMLDDLRSKDRGSCVRAERYVQEVARNLESN